MNQIARVIAENETLRQVQKQAIVNSLVADFFIVNLFISYAGNKQHKPNLKSSATTLATAKLRCLKLQDPPKLTDRKNDIPVKH